MAKEPKPSANKDNSEPAEEVAATEIEAETNVSGDESSDDSPAIIDVEATEVAENSDDDASGDAKEDAVEHPEIAASGESSRFGGGFLSLMLGGIAAGAIGFAAAYFLIPKAPAFDASDLKAEIAGNSNALEALSGDLAALRDAPAPSVDTSGLEGQIADAGQGIASLIDELDAIQGRLTELSASVENQVAGLDGRILELETAMPDAGSLGTEEQLSALRERIGEMTAQAESRLREAETEAAEIARAAEEEREAAEMKAAAAQAEAAAREAELAAMAERQEALIALKGAVESGADYSGLLDDLGEVPKALTAYADEGVPTIQALQESFPDAARAALAATVTVPEDASVGDRISAFLQRRTNARSLSPQEGNGPDAVLSRAESKLGSGDLVAVLIEIETLPEAGQAAMSGWLEAARARLSAVAAIEELSATN